VYKRQAGDSSPHGFVFFSSLREPSRGVFADGATARDPRDAATGSDRERRRGAVARVCAYRERGGRSGAVQRANNRGFERRERRAKSRALREDVNAFSVASDAEVRFLKEKDCRKTVADSIFSV